MSSGLIIVLISNQEEVAGTRFTLAWNKKTTYIYTHKLYEKILKIIKWWKTKNSDHKKQKTNELSLTIAPRL